MRGKAVFGLHERIAFLQSFSSGLAAETSPQVLRRASGREVGGTMGGRMICIFRDAQTAVKRKAKGRFSKGLVF